MTAPKSQAANRVVPMPVALGSILDTYRADLAASEGAERIAPRTLVFSGATGQPLRGTTVTTAARKEWAARDLTPIGLHEARHTYASLSAAAGIRIEDLSEYMGHTSLNMTYKRYRHLYPEARIEARERIDAYLAAATTVPTVSLVDECDD
jgi:integrase